jgi:hypothetical protein
MPDADSPFPPAGRPSDPQGGATDEPAAAPAPRPAPGGRLRALLRRWLLALPAGLLLAAVAATAVWYWLPPGKYLAYVRLYMPSRAPKVLYDTGHEEDFERFQREQLALLRSHRVLEKALSNPNVRRLPQAAGPTKLSAVDRLRDEVSVEFPEGRELPRVTVLGDDPAAPKALVKAVVEAYLDEVRRNHQEHRQTRIEQLKAILGTYEARLQRLQATRNELAKAVGASNDKILVLKQELLYKELAQVQAELIGVNADLRRLELEEKVLQPHEGARGEVSEKLLDAQVEKELEKEKAARKELETRLEKAKVVLEDPEHPTLKKLREELEAKTKSIEEQRKTLRAALKADLLATAAGAQARLTALKDKITLNKQLAKRLTEEVGRLQAQAKDFNNKAIDLDGGRIDLQQAEAGVILVKNELDKAIVELPAPERVKRYDDEAIVVFLDDTPRKVRAALLAGWWPSAPSCCWPASCRCPGSGAAPPSRWSRVRRLQPPGIIRPPRTWSAARCFVPAKDDGPGRRGQAHAGGRRR